MPSVDEPFSLVIFGASGDLTRRKLIPALFERFRSRRDNSFTDRLLAALRNAFGGHAVRR